MNKTLTVALILATLPAVRAADSTEIRLGLATGMAPEYPGSDRYRASVNKNRAPPCQPSASSAALNYDPGRREKSKNKARSLRGCAKGRRSGSPRFPRCRHDRRRRRG